MESNYPPGVTGFELEIAGSDYEKETDELCPQCTYALTECGYLSSRWLVCDNCGYQRDLPTLERFDSRGL